MHHRNESGSKRPKTNLIRKLIITVANCRKFEILMMSGRLGFVLFPYILECTSNFDIKNLDQEAHIYS